MVIPEISPAEAIDLLDADACFVDIRDPGSFAEARIRGARPLSMQTLEAFLGQVSRQQPLVVYCYHGHSSRDATAFLLEQGFEDVRSLQGGFEFWRQRFPETLDTN